MSWLKFIIVLLQVVLLKLNNTMGWLIEAKPWLNLEIATPYLIWSFVQNQEMLISGFNCDTLFGMEFCSKSRNVNGFDHASFGFISFYFWFVLAANTNNPADRSEDLNNLNVKISLLFVDAVQKTDLKMTFHDY